MCHSQTTALLIDRKLSCLILDADTHIYFRCWVCVSGSIPSSFCTMFTLTVGIQEAPMCLHCSS